MPYMVTFTINIPQMLAYIPYMDPMGHIYIYHMSNFRRETSLYRVWSIENLWTEESRIAGLNI
jgi:hypothetical protein